MQTYNPKISIVIPVYNVEQYLRQCLDSVINQTFKDIEIICINDGSTDGSLGILNKYAYDDKRITVISQENRGLACARNSGIKIAKGKYIFFLDSDDYLIPNTLGHLYEQADKMQTDILMSKAKAFTDDTDACTLKKVLSMNEYLDYEEKFDVQVSIENFSQIIDNYPVVSWGSLYKKEFIDKNEIFFIDRKVIHEDNGFFLKTLAMRPKVTFLSFESVMYRIRANSISYESSKKKNRKMHDEQMRIILEDAINYIKQHNPQNAKQIISSIKLSNTYSTLFSIKIKGIFTYIWGLNNKRIKILGLPIYREKIRKNKYIIKILGIPVWVRLLKQLTSVNETYIKRHNMSETILTTEIKTFDTKIPKLIHYCWFGNKPKSALIKKCIASWKKFCPDYEIREWNNEDLKNIKNDYVLEAIKAKKWAFVSDYFRLYALYNYGGIYFDSDNEIFKSFDEFLNLDFFSGYENWNGLISPFTAVVGAKKGCHIVKDLLDEYNNIHFIKPDGQYDLLPNTARVTDYFKRSYNFVEPYNEDEKKILENNCIIYPSNIFCKYQKDVSYAVHHFGASWVEHKPKLTFLQNVFSAINVCENNIKRKQITILGIKIKYKNYKKMYKQSLAELNRVNAQLNYLKEHSDITKLKPATGKLREQQLNILKFINDFFYDIKDLDIKPFLCGGNLIGALRHQGFIPWDDDFDFYLLRDDYEKVINWCKTNGLICYYHGKYSEYDGYKMSERLYKNTQKYPNKYVLDIWFNQLQLSKGTSLEDLQYIDFHPIDFYRDDYTFDMHKTYVAQLQKEMAGHDYIDEKTRFIRTKILENTNIVKNSNQLYYGIDGPSIKKHHTNFIKKDIIFPLKKCKFENTEFYIPNKAEEFANYEAPNWRYYPDDIGISHHNILIDEYRRKTVNGKN